MKHLKLFEEYFINEGAIPVYPPGNPYKQEGSIRWVDVTKHAKKWIDEGQAFTMVCFFDHNKYTLKPGFRSEVLGTWGDKSLPKFETKYPDYINSEFDLVEMTTPEKPDGPCLKIVDKKGFEFLIPPFRVIDIQKGSSVADGIYSGFHYLIDKMKGTIINYKNKRVYVKLQNGEKKDFSLSEWKSNKFTEIEE